VEGLVDPLLGHGDDGEQVEADADDSDAEAGRAVEPELCPLAKWYFLKHFHRPQKQKNGEKVGVFDSKY
jgi:hypothetical protein